MKIDMNKQYQTRGGREVRIYATDCGGDYPVHGAMPEGEDGWGCESWTSDGMIYNDNDGAGIGDHDDLIEKPVKHKIWLNIYDNPCWACGHATKEVADATGSNRIACIEIEYEEGQGL